MGRRVRHVGDAAIPVERDGPSGDSCRCNQFLTCEDVARLTDHSGREPLNRRQSRGQAADIACGTERGRPKW